MKRTSAAHQHTTEADEKHRAAMEHYEKGQSLFCQGNVRSALATYHKVLLFIHGETRSSKNKELNEMTYLAMSKCYWILSKFERCVETCGKRLKLSPSWEALYTRGRANLELQATSQALEDLLRAHELSSGDKEVGALIQTHFPLTYMTDLQGSAENATSPSQTHFDTLDVDVRLLGGQSVADLQIPLSWNIAQLKYEALVKSTDLPHGFTQDNSMLLADSQVLADYDRVDAVLKPPRAIVQLTQRMPHALAASQLLTLTAYKKGPTWRTSPCRTSAFTNLHLGAEIEAVRIDHSVGRGGVERDDPTLAFSDDGSVLGHGECVEVGGTFEGLLPGVYAVFVEAAWDGKIRERLEAKDEVNDDLKAQGRSSTHTLKELQESLGQEENQLRELLAMTSEDPLLAQLEIERQSMEMEDVRTNELEELQRLAEQDGLHEWQELQRKMEAAEKEAANRRRHRLQQRYLQRDPNRMIRASKCSKSEGEAIVRAEEHLSRGRGHRPRGGYDFPEVQVVPGGEMWNVSGLPWDSFGKVKVSRIIVEASQGPVWIGLRGLPGGFKVKAIVLE